MVAAFWDYPETLHLLPDERRRRHVLPRYLLSDARDADRFGLLLVAPDGSGAAAWIPPSAYPIGVGRQLRQLVDLAPALPWAWRAALEARRAQTANRVEHRRHPEHYYLRSIGVDPAAQGRGIGSSLMWPVLDRADREGVGCFLQTATEANVAWYGRFGFETVASYQPTPTWPTTWALWREPNDQAETGTSSPV
jgi:ribosomal protein S18 acetylase RimI-like enzyme